MLQKEESCFVDMLCKHDGDVLQSGYLLEIIKKNSVYSTYHGSKSSKQSSKPADLDDCYHWMIL